MIKILVTGGSGFIGINLIEKLIQEGIDLLNVDIVPPSNPTQVRFHKSVDINNYESLNKIIQQYEPEYIIHLAARTDLNGISMSNYKVNFSGTENLIKAINNCSSVKKVIYASTMLVCKAGYLPTSPEDYCADTIYGESKVQMEKIIRNTAHRFSKWTIVRPTSIWGPWFKAPYRSFFDMLYKNNFFDIGERSCTKTYGYVENSVYQIVKLLFHNDSDRNTYYLGDYEPIFISDWAKEISIILHNKKPIKLPFFIFKGAAIVGDLLNYMQLPFPITSFRLKNMTTNNVVDLKETLKIVGKLPVDRVTGIKKTLNWLNYKNN